MYAPVVGELGVERHGQDVRLAHRHRVPVQLGEHLHTVAERDSIQGARMNTPRQRTPKPVEVEFRLERCGAGGRRRCAGRSRRAARGGRGRAGSGPRRCRGPACPSATSSRSGSARPSRSIAERHGGGLAPGDHQRVEPLELLAACAPCAHPRQAPAGPSRAPRSRPGGRAPQRCGYSPAAVLQEAAAARRIELPDLDAGHRLAQLARRGRDALRVLEVRGGLDDRAGACARGRMT